MKTTIALCLTAGLMAASPAWAGGENGLYRLGDHPDGAQTPPGYGLRLDELFDATKGHDIFSFDFDNAQSAMYMNISPDEIHIYGQSYGGRDVGDDYANDKYLGIYTVDMTYNIGVGQVPGDDDVWVDTANFSNFGTITAPDGTAIPLADYRGDFGYSLRIGDEDNDQGHRGFPGTSGWGWLNHGDDLKQHIDSSDWLFTASKIPSPGAAALLGIGGLLVASRRRA